MSLWEQLDLAQEYIKEGIDHESLETIKYGHSILEEIIQEAEGSDILMSFLKHWIMSQPSSSS